MKRKSVSIYSVFISMAFAFAIIYFAVAMRMEFKGGDYRADKLFHTVSSEIENSADGLPSIDFIERNNYFAAVTIFKNGACIFNYPNENAQHVEDTRFIKVNKKSMTNGDDVLELTVATYVVRPSSIFYYGKISFIIILSATLFAIALIIFYSITDNKTNGEIEYESKESVNEDSEDNIENAEVKDEQNDTDGDTQESVPSEPSIQHEDTNREEQGELDNKEPPSPEIESESKESLSGSSESDFSPQTQLQKSLDAELVRCGSSELDLSLFIIKIAPSEIPEEIEKKVEECLLYKIQFHERIFEYGKNTFAVINPDMEIAQAEDFAEEILNEISRILEGANADCFIGISSRTTRVISAGRLITEAEEALEHAINDENSRIIGFHVDIERYRQYIKNEIKPTTPPRE